MHAVVINQPELGKWFYEKFLKDKGLTAYFVAHSIGVHQNRLSVLTHGRGRFSPMMDVLLCKFYGLKVGYFLQKQLEYDVKYSPKDYQQYLKNVKVLKY